MKKIILLGAGPTNLATADFLLTSKCAEVDIIERLPWVGGICASYQHGPFTLDLGPHRFTPHNDRTNDYVREICGDDLKVMKSQVHIIIGNRFLDYPFKAANVLQKLTFLELGKIGLTFLRDALLPFKRNSAKNYKDWIVGRFGGEVEKLIFRPLIEKMWGNPLTELDARFASQRIAAGSLLSVIKETLRGRQGKIYSSPYYPQNHFLYPEKGFGSIVEGMKKRIIEKGGRIHLGATVNKINISNDRFQSVEAIQDGKTITIHGDSCVSTLPISLFVKMVQPQIEDPAVLAAADGLRFRRLILLNIVVKKDRVSKNTCFYFPSPEIPFGRAFEQKNHSEKMIPSSPGAPRTVFTVEIPCWETDPLWKKTDSELFELTIGPLEKLGLVFRGDVEEVFSLKLGYVYPVWKVNFQHHLDKILEHFKPVENLILNGRPGLFFYNNFHHSLEMGFLAGEHIASGLPKSEKWEKDSEIFKSFQLIE